MRQIGRWQNSCQANNVCVSVFYVSVYDDQGHPLDGVTVKDPIRGTSMTTAKDPGQGPDGQSGHARFQGTGGLNGSFRFYVSSDSTGVVSSEITPTLYSGVPPYGPFYSWQMEFMRKTHRSTVGHFTPTEPTYIFDAVELNGPGGNNPTVDSDHSDVHDGGEMFGQTFVATGDRIISARFELTRGGILTFQYQASIHSLLKNPPASLADIGPQIGPTRTGPANMISSEWWTQMLLWPLDGAGSVPVVPGQSYFAKIRRSDSGGGGYPTFTAFVSDGDYYPSGKAFRQPTGGGLTSDAPNYDVVGYVVGATVNALVCTHDPVFDVVGGPNAGQSDGAVDQQDFGIFQACLTGPGPDPAVFNALSETCKCMDANHDGAIDNLDFVKFQNCATGPSPNVAVDPNCDQ